MKIQLKVYRGEGEGSDGRYITWYSEDERHAKGYADRRSKGFVSNKEIEIHNVLHLGRDSRYLKPAVLANMAIKQNPTVDLSEAKARLKHFIDYFGREEIELLNFWQDQRARKELSTFLKFFDLDSIGVTENNIQTYGILS